MARSFKITPIVGLIVFLGGIVLISTSGEFRNPAYWSVCGVGTLLFLTVFLQEAGRNFSGYVFHGLTALFVAGTLVCIFEITQNRKVDWDVTQGRLNSLAAQSIDYLRTLQTPVHLIAFVNSVETDEKSIAEQLRRYSVYSDLLTFDVRDPVRDTDVVNELKRSDPNLMINYKDTFVIVYDPAGPDPETGAKKILRMKKINSYDEEPLINAIVAMVNDRVYNLYFLQNHGEPNINDRPVPGRPAEHTLITLCQVLHERGFSLRPLNLLEREEIPEDCDILVCVNPMFDLLPAERDRISNWLAAGGKGMFFVNPSQRRDAEMKNFAIVFSRCGIRAKYQELVVDINLATKLTGNPLQYPVAGYGQHVITQDLTQPFQVEWTMPVEAGEDSADFNYRELVFSGPNAWTQTIKEIIETQKARKPEPGLLRRLAIAAVVSKAITAPVKQPVPGNGGDVREMKLLVMGAGEMLLDGKIENTQATLFFNTVNWMLENAKAVALPPRKLEHTPVIMTGLQQRMLMAVLVFLLPSLIFFGGLGYTILRRRMN